MRLFEDTTLLGEVRLEVALERDTGDLMEVDPALIKKARARITELQGMAKKAPFDENADRWNEEAEAIEWSLSDLFSYRLRKIVGMAQTAAISPVEYTISDMLPEEATTYRELVKVLQIYVQHFGIKNDFTLDNKPIDTDDGPIVETIEDTDVMA